MRQTFDETADPSFGPRAPAADPRRRWPRRAWTASSSRTRTSTRTNTCPPPTTGWPGPPASPARPGAAVILKDKAAVFVDGRYTLQVRDQVDPALFEIRDLVEGGVPAYLREAAAGRLDDRLRPAPAQPRRAGRACATAAAKAGAALKPVDDQSRSTPPGASRARPQPQAPVVPHPLDYRRRGLGRQARARRRRRSPQAGADAARDHRARLASPGCSTSAAAT